MNKTQSILIVDDKEENIFVLKKVLKKLNIEIISANDGTEALQALKELEKNEFALAILDIQMPGMSGYELAEKIRQNTKTQYLPIIFLSAVYSDEFHIFKGYQSGGVDFITKPFNAEILTNKVKIFLQLDQQKRDALSANEKLNQEIKERKLVESALKESESRLKDTQRIAAIAHIKINLQENHTTYSENYEHVLGVTPPADAKANISAFNFLDMVEEKEQETVLHFFNSIFSDTSQQHELSFPIKTAKTNSDKYINSIVNYFFDSQKKATALLVTFQDVTLQKRNEELKREIEIAENTAAIREQFLANMSHEIRTPMTGIMGMIDFLANTKLNKKQKDYVDTLKESSENMLNIINDILVTSKIDKGQVEIKPYKFQIPKTIESVYKLYRENAKSKNLEFTLEISNDIPKEIVADENRIKQIISNLISNAIKYTDKGSIAVEAKSIKDRKNNPFVLISVKDTGIGIPKKEQPYIFTKYNRINLSMIREKEGLGLGLVISYELAKLMGGALEFESYENKGSSFYLSIPVKENGKTKKEEPAPPETIEGQPVKINARILLAEDKFVNQKVVSIMLQNLGCEVILANNGQEALDKFEENPPDIVLMDIQMPIMDGITAMQELRKKHTNLPPIIAVSANALEGDAKKYINSGMDDYISKPIIGNILEKKLIQWLDASKIIPQKSTTGASNKKAASLKNDKKENKTDLAYKNLILIDASTINSIRLQAGDDPEFMDMLFKSFIEDSELLLADIEKGQSKNEITIIKNAVHSLKGLSGTIGAVDLYEKSSLVNNKIKNNDLNTLESELDEIKSIYYLTKKKINEIYL